MLSGCGNQAPGNPGHPEEPGAAGRAAAGPRQGGAVVLAVGDDAKSLDPHAVVDAASVRMIENLYSTLLRYSGTYGRFEPDLAQRVELSDDGLTVTITLVPDARFHSGRPVTAEDVAYSLSRIRDTGVRSQHFEAVERLEPSDARTLVLHLREPAPAMEAYLAHPMNAIVDREVVEANDGRLDHVDAGSGPFRLVHWRRGQELVMERFEDYHLPDRPYLDRVTFRPMPDETARTTSLRTGEVDIVNDVAAKDAEILREAPGVTVESAPGTFWHYLGLNTQREPFDDVRVRQAIAWAVDRDQLNRLVAFGRATPIRGGHIPQTHWAYADLSIYPQRDVSRAKALLAEAGLAGGFEATLMVGAAFPYQVAMTEIIKQQLAEIGIDLHLQALESAVFFDALGASDFDMTLVGWVGLVDPDEWTYGLFHSGGRYNQQGYSNPRLDAILEEARHEPRRQRRRELYREAQAIITDEAPMVFLYLEDQLSAWRDRVRGFVVHPTATTIGLRDTWVTDAGESQR